MAISSSKTSCRMDINALVASQRPLSCNFEKLRSFGAVHASASRGPRCRSRWPRASAPQLVCSGALCPGLSFRVGAALPVPPLLSLAHPALSSRVGVAHSARPFLSLALPTPTSLSPCGRSCRSHIPCRLRSRLARAPCSRFRRRSTTEITSSQRPAYDFF